MPKIIAAGHYIGEQTITNDDLSQIIDTNDEWIYSRTGIKKRGFTKFKNSEMAFKALENMKATNPDINFGNIDLIIYATMTPESSMPSQAAKVQKFLKIPNALCFDVSAACSGFVYALNTALSLMKTEKYAKALIIGVDKMSSIIDQNDRSTYVLFGDGAGAILIENDNQDNYISNLGGIIDQNDALIINDQTKIVDMKGQEVYRFAVKYLTEMIKHSIANFDNIDFFVPHQANYRMIESVAKKLKIAPEKILMNIETVANTSAGSIPIVISQNFSKLKNGKKIVMLGFGGGLSYGYIGMEIK